MYELEWLIGLHVHGHQAGKLICLWEIQLESPTLSNASSILGLGLGWEHMHNRHVCKLFIVDVGSE